MKHLFAVFAASVLSVVAFAESAAVEETSWTDYFGSRTELSIYSAYVWRGRIICDMPVWQPAENVYLKFGRNAEYGMLRTRFWGSLYLNSRYHPRQNAGLHVFDVAPAYVKSFGDWEFDVGHIWYTFPQKAKQGARSTDEFFAGVLYRNDIITPSAKLWWDYADKGRNERDMLFLDLNGTHAFKLLDDLDFTVGSGFGVANGPYMRSYTKGEVSGCAFNYFHSDCGLNYRLNEHFTLGASLSYFYNLSRQVRHSCYDMRDDYVGFLRGGFHLVAKF